MAEKRAAAHERSSALIYTAGVDRLTEADWGQVQCTCLSRCTRLEMSLLFDHFQPHWQTSLRFSSICLLGTGITVEQASLRGASPLQYVHCGKRNDLGMPISLEFVFTFYFPIKERKYFSVQECFDTSEALALLFYTAAFQLVLFTVMVCWAKDLSLGCDISSWLWAKSSPSLNSKSLILTCEMDGFERVIG